MGQALRLGKYRKPGEGGGGDKKQKINETKSPKCWLNTQGLRTTKQTKPRPVRREMKRKYLL